MIFVLILLKLCLSQQNYLSTDDDDDKQRRRLDPWYLGCQSCTGSAQTSFADWTICDVSYYATHIGPVFCVPVCPTSFIDGGAPICTAPVTQADQLIISYNFNNPTNTFPNTGSAGAAFDLNAVIAITGPAGEPAKDRGLYFNGSDDGYIPIDNLYLSHTFALHSWVLPWVASQQTIFWQDRDTFVLAGDHFLLKAGLDNSLNAETDLYKDVDPSLAWSLTSATSLINQSWSYLVFSYEMQNGSDTLLEIYINNVADNFITCTDTFYIAKTGYKGFIGLERTNNSPNVFTNLWDGFIYDFNVYQSKHTGSNTNHASTCISGWATWSFSEYADTASCDGSCSAGWVSSRACSLSVCDIVFPNWHLCADVECRSWYGYDIGQCNTASCLQSLNAQESAGQCSCASGYGRASIDELWQQWHPDCTSCDYISATTYQGCQACGTGYGITYNTSNVYWANFCPTPQTQVGNMCVGTLGTVFEAKFEGFGSTWTYNGITLDSFGTTMPAKNRGQYFKRDQSPYMEFTSDFYLNTDFTITSWIRLDELNSGQQWIFAITDAQSSPEGLLQVCIGASGLINFKALVISTGAEEKVKSTFLISAQTWWFIAVASTLDSDAINSTVTFKLNGNTEEIDNLATHFIDNASPVSYKKYVGLRRVVEPSGQGHFGGFIFAFWIENVAQSGQRAQYLDPSLWSSCTLCATADNEWLDNYEFTDFETGTCDASSWTNKGCVRAAAWQSWSFQYCHLWYDIEWLQCTGYTAQDCTQCSANSQSDRTGGWYCVTGFDRQTAGDKNTYCIPCNFRLDGNCVDACPIPSSGWYSDTSGRLCVRCPSNWDTCVSSTTCTICNYPYVLRDDGLCYDSCQGAQYANDSRVWYQCFGTCASCVEGGYDQCAEWAPGLNPAGVTAQVFACDCSNTTNTSKDVKFACVEQTQLVELDSQYALTHLDSITNSENLNEEDFDTIVNTVDEIALITASQQHEAIRVINSAGQETITNSPNVEVEVSTEKFYAKLKADQVADLEGTKILTSTGSGVQIPVNLIQQNVTSIDTTLVVSVVQMKGDEKQRVLGLDGFDVVSVEVYELFSNGTSSLVQFYDLATNFTIIFDGQRFNTTLQHDCVHYKNGNWTNSGCWLSVFDVWYAECSWNHLTEFSLREFLEENEPENNSDVATNFAIAAQYDQHTNHTPLILISSIIAIYILVMVYLKRKDRIRRRQGFHENAQTADQIHEFALQIMAQQGEGNSESSSDSSFMSSSSKSIQYLGKSTSPDMILQKRILYQDDELFQTVENAVRPNPHEMSFSMSQNDVEICDVSQEIFTPNRNEEETTARESHSSQFPLEIQMVKTMGQETQTSQMVLNTQDAQDTVQESPQTSPDNAGKTASGKESNINLSSTLKNRFLEEHPVLGVFYHYEKYTTRMERCTWLFLMIMLTIFTTGLFYNEEKWEEEEEEEDKSIVESVRDIRVSDLYIMFNAAVITPLPPLIIRFLFRRKRIDPTKNYSTQMRARKIKRIIAYVVAYFLAAWCAWSCIAFSLDFGYNKTQRWMMSFCITEIFDFFVKDSLITVVLVVIIICIAVIKERRSMAKINSETNC